MRDSDADIAIDVLNKLIDQELKAASAGMRDGNRILEECASTRYHAYTFARDEIRKALADAVEERDARNPFQCQRDELVTQDMHTCDLCGRWCPSPVYRVCLCYADQSRVASDVCADCMWRLGFRPVGTVPLEAYRRYERWVSEHPTASRLHGKRMSYVENSARTPNRLTISSPCSAIRTPCHRLGGVQMIYLIVDGELVDILTEMDEALAKAKKLAEHAGKVEIADLVTGRHTIIKHVEKGNHR